MRLKFTSSTDSKDAVEEICKWLFLNQDFCFENNGLPNELKEKYCFHEADIVVSGWKEAWKGLKTGELEAVGKNLGRGRLGCSKPVSDIGGVLTQRARGQTGVKVAPTLYIAVDFRRNSTLAVWIASKCMW